MPSSRRSSRKSGGPAVTGGQSILSFGGPSKITKPTAADSTLAKSKKDPSKALKAAVDTKSVKRQRTGSLSSVDVSVESEVEAQPAAEAPAKTEEEVQAAKVSKIQIKRYWDGIESERKAKRVHQEDLSMHEKILRHFDLSSQYGPCIGNDRSKRWKRAQRLNLHPPIEVLAVLVNENETKPGQSERAYVDLLMS